MCSATAGGIVRYEPTSAPNRAMSSAGRTSSYRWRTSKYLIAIGAYSAPTAIAATVRSPSTRMRSAREVRHTPHTQTATIAKPKKNR